MRIRKEVPFLRFWWALVLLWSAFKQYYLPNLAFALQASSFHGRRIVFPNKHQSCRSLGGGGIANLTMRKQKASDRRTRRMQRGSIDSSLSSMEETALLTSSPMARAQWTHKHVSTQNAVRPSAGRGRGRSRKRSNLYNSLSSYHSHFLNLLTTEYKAEEDEIMGRIKASADDPLALEAAGFALFDMYPERRGDLYADEVYRLSKAKDATTFGTSDDRETRELPPNHKFGSNDVILLTLQPGGSGDFFEQRSLPTSSMAVSVEARVLSTGPTYVDVVLPGGSFEAAFGPAPNNAGSSGKGDPRMRLRADHFFSNVPYTRMVAALSQITSLPTKASKKAEEGDAEEQPHDKICMDELLRDTILSTFALNDPSSDCFRDTDACNLRDLAKNLAKPPLASSPKLAKQVLSYISSNPYGTFSQFNGPQLTAFEAAQTRRLTLIQGPPGTGKTTVAAAIGFGFVHQCRNISPYTKVLACAFSNVGADNLAEQLAGVGLKVVRIGKPSAVSETLWDYTLDAAIDKDPEAQKAIRNAAWATSQLALSRRKGASRSQSSVLSERSKRDVATAAVKASIKACNIAATKALREADVIVSTSTGASDPRLLAACGIMTDEDEALDQDKRLPSSRPQEAKASSTTRHISRQVAPDSLPPLSLPFVIVDEACQSVEPATLIPITSTNSCRALVLLGDPCQLPPTVKTSTSSPLSVSLMERLAATLPQPVIVTGQSDLTEKDERFLQSKPTMQARSFIRAMDKEGRQRSSYRKRFSGSLLLSIQYRMHPSISAFSSAVFYDGLLATPTFLESQRLFPEALLDEESGPTYTKTSVRFVNVGGPNNERRGARGKLSTDSLVVSGDENSYWNQQEADQVIALLKKLLTEKSAVEGEGPPTIGVVTPYNGQVELIKSLISSDRELKDLTDNLAEPIEVKSVDGYQGRERDVIIFSAVRSNRQAKVGFLSDWRRMNVALTRARSALLVIGDFETLSVGDKHWAAFGNWCRAMNCLQELNDESTDEKIPS